jgi:predicted GIY-YIG superfamily endonuclease
MGAEAERIVSSHVLYRFFSGYNELLYVGITNNPPSRFRSHGDNQVWWRMVDRIELTHYSDRKTLKQAEREAIQAEAPVFNVAGAGRHIQEFVEEAKSDLFLDEMFAAVAATGITDVDKALKEYRATGKAS